MGWVGVGGTQGSPCKGDIAFLGRDWGHVGLGSWEQEGSGAGEGGKILGEMTRIGGHFRGKLET